MHQQGAPNGDSLRHERRARPGNLRRAPGTAPSRRPPTAQPREYGEHTAETIDAQARCTLDEAHERVTVTLESQWVALNRLVHSLLESNGTAPTARRLTA